MEIVCPDVFPTLASGLTPTLSLEAKLAATAGEDPDVLLAKPANPEQLAIAHEVEHNNVVLVQGPPGTGKTHTIANLLGHFLSQGKRVLVTSHTTKALSVVKDLLPKEIQPLCVTMLGDRKDLEQTSSELITRLTRLNVEDLEARIRALGLERHRLGTALADRRRRIFEQRRIEHEAVDSTAAATRSPKSRSSCARPSACRRSFRAKWPKVPCRSPSGSFLNSTARTAGGTPRRPATSRACSPDSSFCPTSTRCAA